MNIMFIVPPDTLSIESSVFHAYEKERGEYPKLGMLYVAAYLEEEFGDTTAIRRLSGRVTAYRPDLVAFSVLTFNLLDARKAASLLLCAHHARCGHHLLSESE